MCIKPLETVEIPYRRMHRTSSSPTSSIDRRRLAVAEESPARSLARAHLAYAFISGGNDGRRRGRRAKVVQLGRISQHRRRVTGPKARARRASCRRSTFARLYLLAAKRARARTLFLSIPTINLLQPGYASTTCRAASQPCTIVERSSG